MPRRSRDDDGGLFSLKRQHALKPRAWKTIAKLFPVLNLIDILLLFYYVGLYIYIAATATEDLLIPLLFGVWHFNASLVGLWALQYQKDRAESTGVTDALTWFVPAFLVLLGDVLGFVHQILHVFVPALSAHRAHLPPPDESVSYVTAWAWFILAALFVLLSLVYTIAFAVILGKSWRAPRLNPAKDREESEKEARLL